MKKSLKALIAATLFVFALTALFACEETATVSFDADGGTETTSLTVTLGEYATRPEAPTKDGYAFAGWFLGLDEWDFEHYPVVSDMTLKAKWIETYTVYFNTDGGTATNPQTLTLDTCPTRPQDPTREGYVFAGWYTAEGAEWLFTEAAPNADLNLTAKWLKRHTVTLEDTSSDGESAKQTVTEGETLTEPTAPTRTGYTFLGWYYGNKKWSFDTDLPTGDMKLLARWAENCTVTFDSNGGTAIAPLVAAMGQKATAPTEPTRQFYDFAGWYSGDKLWDFEASAIPGNMTLTAKWTLKRFTVTFDANGATVNIPTTETVGALEKLTKPTAPTMAGYTFLGWFNGETEWRFETDTVQGDLTLTAKWAKNYTVTFNANGGTTVPAQTVPNGSLATEPPVPTRTNYAFDGWYVGGAKWDFTRAVTSDITLTAKWTQTFFTVIFKVNGGEPTIANQNVARGAKVQKPADPTREGYIFVGWYTEQGKFNFDEEITANVTLTAEWTRSFTVSFDTDGGSAVAAMTVPHDTPLTPYPEVPTRSGYRFVKWYYIEGERDWDFETDVVTSDITLKVIWQKTVTVTFKNGDESTTSTVDEGATVQSPAAPTRGGYLFLGWFLEDAEESFDFNGTAISEDITLTARFEELYSVTFDTGDETPMGCSPITGVRAGSKITAPVDPISTSFVFAGWYFGDKEWNFDTDTMPAENITLTAKWVAKTWTVSFDSDGGDGDYPDLIVEYGEKIPKPETDPTREGYKFDGWYFGDKKWDFDNDVVDNNVATGDGNEVHLVAKYNDDEFNNGVVGPMHDWSSGG